MKVSGTITAYPYLHKDGSIDVRAFYDDSGLWGVCMVEKECGTVVEYEIDVDVSNPTESAIKSFDRKIAQIRTDAEIAIEKIETAKQKFMALEAA